MRRRGRARRNARCSPCCPAASTTSPSRSCAPSARSTCGPRQGEWRSPATSRSPIGRCSGRASRAGCCCRSGASTRIRRTPSTTPCGRCRGRASCGEAPLSPSMRTRAATVPSTLTSWRCARRTRSSIGCASAGGSAPTSTSTTRRCASTCCSMAVRHSCRWTSPAKRSTAAAIAARAGRRRSRRTSPRRCCCAPAGRRSPLRAAASSTRCAVPAPCSSRRRYWRPTPRPGCCAPATPRASASAAGAATTVAYGSRCAPKPRGDGRRDARGCQRSGGAIATAARWSGRERVSSPPESRASRSNARMSATRIRQAERRPAWWRPTRPTATASATPPATSLPSTGGWAKRSRRASTVGGWLCSPPMPRSPARCACGRRGATRCGTAPIRCELLQYNVGRAAIPGAFSPRPALARAAP